MRRRGFLRLASVATVGIVGLAGCGAPGPEAEETETPDGTETAGGAGATETETEMMTETETATEIGTETTTGAGGATETETGTETGTGTANGTPAGSYKLGGKVEAWIGQEPQSIADEENPTIELTAGETYEVTWENLDGVSHDFTIQDADGNNLEGTETMSEEGATRTLTFTATEEMAQYICTIHPTTMVGDITLSGG